MPLQAALLSDQDNDLESAIPSAETLHQQSDLQSDLNVEPDHIPERLLLGMTLTGLLRLCELVGFKKVVHVSAPPCGRPKIWPQIVDLSYQRGNDAFWSNTISEGCGYDLIAAIKAWQASVGRHCQEKSVCDFLYNLDDTSEEGQRLDAKFWKREIGPADIFYSHAQMLPLEATFDTMDPSYVEAAYRFSSSLDPRVLSTMKFYDAYCSVGRDFSVYAKRRYRYWIDYVTLRQNGPPICQSDW